MGMPKSLLGLIGARLRTTPFSGAVENQCDILSVSEFRRLLEQERARSDRTGHQFSVVVFSPGKKQKRSTSCRLPEYLLGRTRTTDSVGWFDDAHVGVLLPGTAEEGARIFSHSVFWNIEEGSAPPVSQIYTYPSHLSSQKKERLFHRALDKKPEEMIKQRRAEPTAPHPPEKESFSPDIRQENLEPHFGRKIPLWKRLFDILAAGLGILIAFPVMTAIAIIIKVISPGPALFKQTRIGYLGKPFTIWKYRTMHAGAGTQSHQDYMKQLINSDIPMKKLEGDPRVFSFGGFLRNSGLDELPQLFNVLFGQMSLVGPRPCLPYEFEEFLLWHKRRFYTLPGITGLWQVTGKNDLTFNEMIRLDITYERRQSFWLDLKIIFKTLPILGMLMAGEEKEVQP
jgi:lipopolysaccharide/colanic/teichoic acid biosynthesis glycosyltransferase